jgi:hypothetical protein
MDEHAHDTILWQGKIALKAFMLARGKYAYVYEDRIVITQNNKPDSKVFATIPRRSITSIKFPHFGAKEMLLTGIQGFGIWYRVHDKNRRIHFWPNTFGAIPDDAGMKKLTEVMAIYVGKEKEDVMQYAEAISVAKYLLTVISLIVGFVWASIMGVIFFGLAAAGTLVINSKKELHIVLKVLLVFALYIAAATISVILQLMLLSALGLYN